ncbi:hypothetical protein CKO25_11665 [Thiocapsa imhoffii]|uniref:Uncharacterized protein n=1 Tax=Thiocapsa imhoffii TaxID=382777 RepID=A0A9X0WID9_9GAMM|nr:hypothetical protein [Thiocapsa imhoffii]
MLKGNAMKIAVGLECETAIGPACNEATPMLADAQGGRRVAREILREVGVKTDGQAARNGARLHRDDRCWRESRCWKTGRHQNELDRVIRRRR